MLHKFVPFLRVESDFRIRFILFLEQKDFIVKVQKYFDR